MTLQSKDGRLPAAEHAFNPTHCVALLPHGVIHPSQLRLELGELSPADKA